MKKQTIVTTSWDDGHKLDLKLAGLLKKYEIKGTFYISPENREFKKEYLLSDEEIIKLNMDFEIGAHTMTHPELTAVSEETAFNEIMGSKRYLENLLGEKVRCFCYPCGKYNKKIIQLVERSGFCYARTMEKFLLHPAENLLSAGTTMETHRNSLITLPLDSFNILKFSGFNLMEFFRSLHWEYLAKKTFDYVKEHGGVYHLWGHSWVIEKSHDWEKVEQVFSYISKKINVEYLTNYEMVKATK